MRIYYVKVKQSESRIESQKTNRVFPIHPKLMTKPEQDHQNQKWHARRESYWRRWNSKALLEVPEKIIVFCWKPLYGLNKKDKNYKKPENPKTFLEMEGLWLYVNNFVWEHYQILYQKKCLLGFEADALVIINILLGGDYTVKR